MLKKAKPAQSDALVQSNKVNLARHDLSSIQKKLVALVYAKVRLEDNEFHDYEFYRQDIARAFHREADGNYDWLKDECKKILKQVIAIPNPLDPEGWTLSVFFTDITYSPKAGTVVFHLAPKLKPYFLQLKAQYTVIPLSAIMRLSGKYALRILDIIMQWGSLIEAKGEYSISLPIEELRTAWGLDDKYRTARAFRQLVIDKAIIELNAADLGFRVEAETDMVGKRARGFILHVTRQRREDPKPIEKPTEDELAVENLDANDRAIFDRLLAEIKANGELFPLAGYSTPFMREQAQIAEALCQLQTTKKSRPRKKHIAN